MAQATSAGAHPALRLCCACERDACSGEMVEVSSSLAKEIFIRCAPATTAEPSSDFVEQAARFYGCLPRLLANSGARMAHVVTERVFFASFERDMQAFRDIRRHAYADEGVDDYLTPAITYIEQPPCRPGQQLELQVYAVAPHSEAAGQTRTFHTPEEESTAKLVELGGVKHLYISNVSGAVGGNRPATFRQQSDSMFEKTRVLLRHHGAKFPQVLRTWCYLKNIDRDYAEFNESRNAFFAREGVTRLPASTGIEAGLHPASRLCGIDLYAVLNPEGVAVEVMQTPTLNEACEYGSSFSRGMKVALPEKTVLYISGTASVDEAGATVHVDDLHQQIERMFVNVQGLLEPHGAGFSDFCQATTYLKKAEYLDAFLDAAQRWNLRGVPNTIVQAGVCRPELLCEMEAIAIVPKTGAAPADG